MDSKSTMDSPQSTIISNLLDYIILALIFVIVINFLMKIFFKKNTTENMGYVNKVLSENVNALVKSENTDQNNQYNKYAEPIIHVENNVGNNAENNVANFDEYSTNFDEFKPSVQEQVQVQEQEQVQQKQVQVQEQVQQKQLSESDFKYTDHIKNYENEPDPLFNVQSNDFDSAFKLNKRNKFTKDEILAYQDSMYNFTENINNSSSGVDVVDRINQLYTEGNNENIGLNFRGKTISEVYDGLTQNMLDRKKKCVNKGCLIPPNNVDYVSKVESYIMSNDKEKYFRHGLMYEDDDVSNGSKFYNDIEASDSEFEKYPLF